MVKLGELHPLLSLLFSPTLQSHCSPELAPLKVTSDPHLGRFSVFFPMFISLDPLASRVPFFLHMLECLKVWSWDLSCAYSVDSPPLSQPRLSLVSA